MQYTLFIKMKNEKRKKILWWLSTLGKFSIADIFVVCILISVCNLHLILKPELILQNANKLAPKLIKVFEASVTKQDAIRDICNDILQLHCSFNTNIFKNLLAPQNSVSCNACIQLTTHLYANPGTLESFVTEILQGLTITGSGYANLRIAGLAGLHVFCIAVLSSMVIGLFIEVIGHNCDLLTENEELSDEEKPLIDTNDKDKDKVVDAILLNKDSLYLPFISRYKSEIITRKTHFLYVCFSIIGIILGLIGFSTKSMGRSVPGSIPSVINETLEYDFREKYSFWGLINVIGGKFYSFIFINMF